MEDEFFVFDYNFTSFVGDYDLVNYTSIDWDSEGPILVPEKSTWPRREQLITSLTFLCVAAILWTLVWIKRRSNTPYRYAPIILSLLAGVLSLCPEVHHVVTNSLSFSLGRTFFTYTTYQISCFCLSGYALLCLLQVQKNGVTMPQIAGCIVGCAVAGVLSITVWFVAAHLDVSYHVVDIFFIIGTVLRLLVLLLGLALALYLIFKLFLKNGAKSRDTKLIRCSCVGLSFLLAYTFACEIAITVCHMTDLVCTYEIFDVTMKLFSIRGIVVFVCLCIFDLEVLSLLPFLNLDQDDNYENLADDKDTKPFKDSEAPPATNETTPAEGGKGHVTSFEMDLTSRINLQGSKPAYGSIPGGR